MAQSSQPPPGRLIHSLPQAGACPGTLRNPALSAPSQAPPHPAPWPSLNQGPSHPLPNLFNPPGGPASPRGASCTPLQGNSHHTEPGETIRAGSEVGGGRADPFRRGGEIGLAASRAVLMLLAELSYMAPPPPLPRSLLPVRTLIVTSFFPPPPSAAQSTLRAQLTFYLSDPEGPLGLATPRSVLEAWKG